MLSLLRAVGLAVIIGTVVQAQVAVAQSSPGLCVDSLSAAYNNTGATITVDFQAAKFRPEGTIEPTRCYEVPISSFHNTLLWRAVADSPESIQLLMRNVKGGLTSNTGNVVVPIEALICEGLNGTWLFVDTYVKAPNSAGYVGRSEFHLKPSAFERKTYCLPSSDQVRLLTQAVQFLLSK